MFWVELLWNINRDLTDIVDLVGFHDECFGVGGINPPELVSCDARIKYFCLSGIDRELLHRPTRQITRDLVFACRAIFRADDKIRIGIKRRILARREDFERWRAIVGVLAGGWIGQYRIS